MTKRPAGKQERLPRQAGQPVSSSSPLGLLALYLLDVWRRPKSKGLIFVSEDERRAEQVGAILHAFEPQSGVMVLPRLDAFPFDGLQPSRELTGRRASVLRRMAEAPEQTLLIATAEALSRLAAKVTVPLFCESTPRLTGLPLMIDQAW